MSSMIDRRTEAVLNADIAQDNIQEKSPRLSFIVPVYNVEQHLARCLDSLVGQTFQDIEIIVVNDGSVSYTHLDVYKRQPQPLLNTGSGQIAEA